MAPYNRYTRAPEPQEPDANEGKPFDIYLPNPNPVSRCAKPNAGACTRGGGGFHSLRRVRRSPRARNRTARSPPREKPVPPERVFMSYGDWWQAQQPDSPRLNDCADKTAFSTNCWPYGNQLSTVTGTCDKTAAWMLDGKLCRFNIPGAPARPRSSSTSVLPGATEHFDSRRLTGRGAIVAAGLLGSSGEAVIARQGHCPTGHDGKPVGMAIPPEYDEGIQLGLQALRREVPEQEMTWDDYLRNRRARAYGGNPPSESGCSSRPGGRSWTAPTPPRAASAASLRRPSSAV
eukprot:gnl/TRDRNA2_/TRDRNA2_186776_c0_seq1.p1 gnl/TRDRNA2_/TRDRNA2_186776_c0~~gnl/TRDRNA2_/TRDRNA2_186776_c0_seq1.p1  ORF type:complete len:290 (+),score=14.10 gnl/TRDRNA2_/TRDRNA2_186776_c0_seq1:33-902(+)